MRSSASATRTVCRPVSCASRRNILAPVNSPRDRWQQSAVAPDKQRDTVPARSLPPVSSLDVRADGRKIGPCPSCGGHRWWDNRGAKRAGQGRAGSADFKCVNCGHGANEADPPAPFPDAVVVPTQVPASASSAGVGGFRRCTALKKNGERCANGAASGLDVCGPHASSTAGRGGTHCQGVTKAGQPCRAGAMKGNQYCPQHEPRD